MPEFFPMNGIWAVLLTCATFQLGQYLRKKSGSALCNPILISAIIVIAFLVAFDIPNDTYQSSMKLTSWLMTPCTVCLGIPLYTQLKRMKGNLPAIFIGVVAGTVSSLVLIGLMCLVLGLDDSITAALLPKSITTAMAIPLVEPTVGLVPLTTSAVIISGIIGSMGGQAMCRLFGIRHHIAQGVAYGTASHVIGTSRATEINELIGAVGSLSLCIAGILTAVLYPFALMIFVG